MNFWPRYVGDIQRKTGHLSCAEMGVYDRFLDHIYATEQPLPGDLEACCRIARAMDKSERKAVESVLRQFFSLECGQYTNCRAAEEIAKAQPKIEAARTNGARGGRPRKNPEVTQEKPTGFPAGTHDEPNSKALQNQSSSSLRSEEPPKPPRGSVHGFPPGFDRLWSVYPRKVGKDAAAKAFAKRKPDAALVETMVKAVEVQRQSRDWTKDGGQFIPHLSTWLNEGRWMDEIASSARANDIFAGAM